MLTKKIGITACLLALLALAVAPAARAASGDKVKNKGVITLRTGDTLTVKTSEGVFMVTINSDTKIQHEIGASGSAQEAGFGHYVYYQALDTFLDAEVL